MDREKLLENIIVEGMIEVISRKYSYLAIKQDEFCDAKSILESESKGIDDYNEFRRIAVNALSHLQDGHIRVIDGLGKSHSSYKNMIPKNYDFDVTEGYFSDTQKKGPITLAKLDDVVYIGIHSFGNCCKEHFDWLYQRDPPSEKKFIVDLRANGGGNDSLGRYLTSFMLGAEGPFISSYLRFRTDEEDPTKLTEFRPRYVMPLVNSFRREVTVLTGARTYSSAELITMDLAAIPGTILIGDVTGGGSGCPQRYLVDGPRRGEKIDHEKKPYDFQAKFALDIPSWLSYRLDQVLVQNNGIPPHILIKPQDSIVSNRDCVLERAIQIHKEGYIAK
jgi:C-terminal processing protease CtpA/Prc